MAIKLDYALLRDVGYSSLTASQADLLLKDAYNTLELVVGTTLAADMNDDQLDAFEAFFESKDDAGALRWLERNFPDYRDRVNKSFESVKDALRTTAREVSEGGK